MTPYIVICGSTRYFEEMKEVEKKLTWKGNCVFAPTKCNMKTPDPLWADPEEFKAGAERLARLHRAQISVCDFVLVYGDYAGESVRSEIQYAKSWYVEIFFTSEKLAQEFGGEVYVV